MPLSTIAGRNTDLIRKALDAVVFIAPSTSAAPTSLTTGTNEVQTVTITGSPTGGTFSLTYAGQTTSGIAYNAVASAVQSALEALSNIAPGDITVTGGPGPSTPYVVTFVGPLADTDVAQMTASGALLTGGTSPAVTVTTTTPGANDLSALPTGYVSLGWHTKDDGLSWGRDVQAEEVTSHGSVEPTRRDITSDTMTLALNAQESKLKTFELYHNISLTSVTPTAGTGEIAFNRATAPATSYYRVLAVAQDGSGTDAIYIARFLPRAIVSEIGEQAWNSENEIVYPLTFTATVDNTLGYAMREFWAGPGLKTRLVTMGFPAAG